MSTYYVRLIDMLPDEGERIIETNPKRAAREYALENALAQGEIVIVDDMIGGSGKRYKIIYHTHVVVEEINPCKQNEQSSQSAG